jgi:hypothetical protein
MNIYLAAGIIVGAVLGLGAAVVGRIAVRGVMDSRTQAVQLTLPKVDTKSEDHHLQPT